MVQLDVLCPQQKTLSGHIFTILNYVLQEPNRKVKVKDHLTYCPVRVGCSESSP